MSRLRGIGVGVLALFGVLTAEADPKTCVWTGQGDGKSWNDGANWQGEAKPANGDAVEISGTSLTTVNDIGELSLASLSVMATTSFSLGEKNTPGFGLVLSGDSYIRATNAAVTNYAAITLQENVKFEFNGNAASIWNGDLAGAGSFYKRGAGNLTIQGCDNSRFSGDWHFRRGTVSVYAVKNVFGTGVVNVYGQDKSGREPGETSGATLYFRRNVDASGKTLRFANNLHFYYHAALYSGRGIELDGDILFSSYHTDEEFRLATATDGSYYGYINVNGSLRMDPDAHIGKVTLYTSDIRHKIRFAGPEVDLQDKVFSYSTHGTFCFGSPVKTTSTASALVNGTYERTFVFEKANVLPAGCLWQFGHASKDTKFKVDLNGYDQRCGQIAFIAPGEGISCEGELTSERAPATVSVHDARPTSARNFCSINGQLSLEYVYDADMPERTGTKSFYFKNLCNTTGRIAAKSNVLLYLQNEFPNLSEVEIAGKGIVLMSKESPSQLNAQLTIHDLDHTATGTDGYPTTGYFHAGDGLQYRFRRVMVDDVDQEAGRYRREKAGATAEVHAPSWMQSGTGEVVIPDHDMRWVWTGAGDGTSIASAANWAANAAPDLTTGNTILDFKYANGATAFAVNGDWRIAGLEGERNTTLYTFGGTGSLTLTGKENCTICAKFTDALAVSYAGSACQTLRQGVSDATGRFSVQSGTVALTDGAGLTGAADVSIAQGAQLALAEGVAAKANRLMLNGAPAHRGVWGSSASAAARVDDIHFVGLGTLEALHANGGLMLLLK